MSNLPTAKRPRISQQQQAPNDIPSSSHYHVSYAHRSIITFLRYSTKHDMILTASEDGIIKFWKRTSISSPLVEKKSDGGMSSNKSSNPTGECLEFIKSYVAHTAPFTALVISCPDGDIAASIGEDNVIKFYDIGSFDVTGMIQVAKDKYKMGSCATFVGEEQTLLAVSTSMTDAIGRISIFSSMSLSPMPIRNIQLHSAPLTAMEYNHRYHCMISTDEKGMIEYSNGSLLAATEQNSQVGGQLEAMNDYDKIEDIGVDTKAKKTEEERVKDAAYSALGEAPTRGRNGITFSSKIMDTDLLSLLKSKKYVVSLAMSPTGEHFAVYGSDRKVRLYQYTSGKIVVRYDERMKVYDALVNKRSKASQENTTTNNNSMDAIDYGKRAAREREMAETSILSLRRDGSYQECGNQSLHLSFDPSGRFLLIPTIVGIKVIEWSTNKCTKIIGRSDSSMLRFLGGLVCLGEAKVDKQMQLARSGGTSAARSTLENEQKLSDALMLVMAYNKRRFYIFSHVDPIANAEKEEGAEQQETILARDILNEPPDADDYLLDNINDDANKEATLGKEAILRTTMGDVHIRLFPDEVPRTIENFCGHARSGYYDNVIFHRIIKGFMIQTGDPLGDGTGGESIWGGEFEDEFVRG